jgi:hypothetical protein
MNRGFDRLAFGLAFMRHPSDADLDEARAHVETLRPDGYQLEVMVDGGEGASGRKRVESATAAFLVGGSLN